MEHEFRICHIRIKRKTLYDGMKLWSEILNMYNPKHMLNTLVYALMDILRATGNSLWLVELLSTTISRIRRLGGGVPSNFLKVSAWDNYDMSP